MISKPLHRAMSLVEILFAMALLSMFMLAIVMVVIRGMDLNRRDSMITQSTMYCNEVLERDARLAASPTTFSSVTNVTYAMFPNQTEFIYSQQVSDYSANTTVGSTVLSKKYIKVTVGIFYQDPQSVAYAPDPHRPNGARVVQMCRLFAQPDANRGAP